jgi:hypothetical protein
LRLLFPDGVTKESLAKKCEDSAVKVLSLSDTLGFDQTHWGELPDMQAEIERERRSRGTYRGTLQITAEAQVLLMIRNLRSGKYKLSEDSILERVYFVSQSRVLDAISLCPDIITWTPEALYRYLISLPGVVPDVDLLQECIMNDFFYAGVDLVDKDKYLRFFGPAINQAKINYKEEKDRYLEAVEKRHVEQELDEAFEKTPDFQKPFFVSQMAWAIALDAQKKQQEAERKASESSREASDAKKKLREHQRSAEVEKKARIRAEQEVNRLKNLRDPKYSRKRLRQAKKKRTKNRRK